MGDDDSEEEGPVQIVCCAGGERENEHPPPLGNDCPLCGDNTEMGFGLAYGGYGIYWVCIDGECPYFYKIQCED